MILKSFADLYTVLFTPPPEPKPQPKTAKWLAGELARPLDLPEPLVTLLAEDDRDADAA